MALLHLFNEKRAHETHLGVYERVDDKKDLKRLTLVGPPKSTRTTHLFQKLAENKELIPYLDKLVENGFLLHFEVRDKLMGDVLLTRLMTVPLNRFMIPQKIILDKEPGTDVTVVWKKILFSMNEALKVNV
jgi:hypothetical protein